MKLLWKTLCWGFFAAGLLFASVNLTGCYSSSLDPIFTDNPLSPATTGSPGETLVTSNLTEQVALFHVGDPVTVSLTGLPETIEPHTEPIKEDGTITMPSIGHVQAAGKTAGELQNEIHDLYVPKHYTHLTVTATLGDRVYYVTGEVKAPGRQLYAGQMTVTKAITTAGGFTDFAKHKRVWLVRARGHPRIKVNCDKAIAIFHCRIRRCIPTIRSRYHDDTFDGSTWTSFQAKRGAPSRPPPVFLSVSGAHRAMNCNLTTMASGTGTLPWNRPAAGGFTLAAAAQCPGRRQRQTRANRRAAQWRHHHPRFGPAPVLAGRRPTTQFAF